MYFSNYDLQRPFGSISGMLAFEVYWFEETLRGAKSEYKSGIVEMFMGFANCLIV